MRVQGMAGIIPSFSGEVFLAPGWVRLYNHFMGIYRVLSGKISVMRPILGFTHRDFTARCINSSWQELALH